MIAARWARTFCLVAALAVASRGSARGADPQAAFEEGKTRFDRLEYAAALPHFESALVQSGSPNARLYVARCLRELGRLAEAYEQMATVVREAAAKGSSEARFVKTRDAATAELAELERRVARVYFFVEGPADGVTVRVNARPVPRERVGTSSSSGERAHGSDPRPVAVEPGEIVVEIGRDGATPITRRFRVAPGPPEPIVVAAPPAGASSKAPTDWAAPVERDGGAGPGPRRILGYSLGGLGLAAVGVGAAFGVAALSKKGDADALCTGTKCTQAGLDGHDEANGLANVSNVAVGTGIALVAAAVVVIVTSPAEGPKKSAIVAAPGGAGWTF